MDGMTMDIKSWIEEVRDGYTFTVEVNYGKGYEIVDAGFANTRVIAAKLATRAITKVAAQER
jgi:hypothetical protein